MKSNFFIISLFNHFSSFFRFFFFSFFHFSAFVFFFFCCCVVVLWCVVASRQPQSTQSTVKNRPVHRIKRLNDISDHNGATDHHRHLTKPPQYPKQQRTTASTEDTKPREPRKKESLNLIPRPTIQPTSSRLFGPRDFLGLTPRDLRELKVSLLGKKVTNRTPKTGRQ